MVDVEKGLLAAEVVAELKRLRKGEGVQASDLARRIGPRLYAMLESSAATDLSVLRMELCRLLDSATVALSTEHRRQALVALALPPTPASLTLEARLERLAQGMQREVRTVRRHVDRAHVAMGSVLAERFVAAREGNAHIRYGWNVESLSSTLSFEADRPVLVERREVYVVDRELGRITANLTLAGEAAEGEQVTVEPRKGCTLEAVRTVGGRFLAVDLALPRTLRFGEPWEYEVAFVLPHRDAMGPFYGFAPLRPSRHFSAEIVFADAGDVSDVRLLDGVPQVVIENPDAARLAGTPAHLQGARVRIDCEGPRQGLCYGLRWNWRNPPRRPGE